MKPYKLILIIITAFIYGHLAAQSGKIKQPPKVNVVKISVTKVNTKIHANSNSVFGTGNTHPNYDKRTPPKKGEIKNNEEPKKIKAKKKKK